MGKQKRIKIGVLVIVIISILMLDIRLIKYINAKEEEGYWQQNYIASGQEIEKNTIKTEFQAVSKNLTRLDLWIDKTEQPLGEITYWVEDESGNSVLEKQRKKINEIWDKENSCLFLEVSGGEFQPGEHYLLITEFELQEPLSIIMDARGIMVTQQYQVDYQWLLYIGMVVVNVLLAAALIAFWKWGWNDKLFFGIVVVVGLMGVFITPPFARDDEFRHFVRAYDLSYGGEKGYLGKPQKDVVGNVIINSSGQAELIEIPQEISELRLVDYGYNYNMVSYHSEVNTGLCVPKLLSVFKGAKNQGTVEVAESATSTKRIENYWPQVLMLKLGRLLHLGSGLWYYLAGIGQVLVTGMMLLVAVSLAKEHRNLIILCGLLPVSTLLRASSNPDGLMIAEIILCLGIILHLRETGIKLITKKAAILLALYIIFVYQVYIMKMPYAVLCLGFLLLLRKENFSWLPWEFIRKNKIRLTVAGTALVVFLGVYLIVIRSGKDILPFIYSFLPKEHCEYILTNFKEFLGMYLLKGAFLGKETFDSLRGDYYIPYGILAAVVLILSQKKFHAAYKCYHVFLYLCMLGLVVLVGYTLAPPDYEQIVGIGYRYMLPALPILGLALPLGTEKTEGYVNEIYPLLLIPAVFASCLSWLYC